MNNSASNKRRVNQDGGIKQERERTPRLGGRILPLVLAAPLLLFPEIISAVAHPQADENWFLRKTRYFTRRSGIILAGRLQGSSRGHTLLLVESFVKVVKRREFESQKNMYEYLQD